MNTWLVLGLIWVACLVINLIVAYLAKTKYNHPLWDESGDAEINVFVVIIGLIFAPVGASMLICMGLSCGIVGLAKKIKEPSPASPPHGGNEPPPPPRLPNTEALVSSFQQLGSAAQSSTRALQQVGRIQREQPKPKPLVSTRFALLSVDDRFVFWSPKKGTRNRVRFRKTGEMTYCCIEPGNNYGTRTIRSVQVAVVKLQPPRPKPMKKADADRWDDI